MAANIIQYDIHIFILIACVIAELRIYLNNTKLTIMPRFRCQ